MTAWVSAAKRLTLDPLLMGFYAWILTVAVPSFSPEAPLLSRALSLLALAILISGWIAAIRFPTLSDGLATAGYFGACLATWLILGHARLTANLAELRTLLGAVAWCLFGVAWVRARHAVALSAALSSTEAPHAPPHVGQKTIRGLFHLAFSLSVALAVFLKIGILGGDGRGVLIAATAIGWALWLLATAGVLAERVDARPKAIGPRLLTERTLIFALLLAAAGIIVGTLYRP